MDGEIKGVTWEALEHIHDTKGSDWLWALGILVVAIAITSMYLGNMLFGILVLISGAVMAILSVREPKVVPYAVTQRGIRVEDKLYPYSTLECFYIDEEDSDEPILLVKSEKLFMPLLVMPLPEEYLDDIDNILSARLPEIELEEPLIHKIFEFLGF